jgi:hypothetical protein
VRPERREQTAGVGEGGNNTSSGNLISCSGILCGVSLKYRHLFSQQKIFSNEKRLGFVPALTQLPPSEYKNGPHCYDNKCNCTSTLDNKIHLQSIRSKAINHKQSIERRDLFFF